MVLSQSFVVHFVRKYKIPFKSSECLPGIYEDNFLTEGLSKYHDKLHTKIFTKSEKCILTYYVDINYIVVLAAVFFLR